MIGRWGLFCIISMVSIVSGASGQVVTMAYWDFGPDAAGYTEQVLIDNITDTSTLTLQDGDKDLNGKVGLSYRDQAGTLHLSGRVAAWHEFTKALSSFTAIENKRYEDAESAMVSIRESPIA